MEVIWSVALESIIHEFLKNLSKVLMQKTDEGLPESANEQVLEVLSRDPNELFNFPISSLLSSPVAEFSSVLDCFVKCA